MCAEHTSVRATRALPARPNLEHLKNEAKQRLKALRVVDPAARLADVQLVLARDYGFASWRQHVEREPLRERVFAAAATGDVDAVRDALGSGFDPHQGDAHGRTVHQIAKEFGHEAIELLAREYEERDTNPPEMRGTIASILDAAEKGHADRLARLLDDHPGLIDARGGNFQKQTALHKAAWRNQRACVELLLARGADVRIRDTGDNACALHFAAEAADLAIVKLLVEAGSDVIGEGDDHRLKATIPSPCTWRSAGATWRPYAGSSIIRSMSTPSG